MMSSHPGIVSVTLSNASAALFADRGKGSLKIEHHKSGFIWRIHQMAIACYPVAKMQLTTMFNGLPLMTPITVISGACADGEPWIDIGDHDVVEVAVLYGPPSGNVTLSYFYEELGAA